MKHYEDILEGNNPPEISVVINLVLDHLKEEGVEAKSDRELRAALKVALFSYIVLDEITGQVKYLLEEME